MANTFKFGNGNWAVKDGYALAYNDENNNFKPLPFDFTRASTATRVNKQGLVEVVPSGKPRIDFLDNTSGHLLLEPSRTNRSTHSENFSNSVWSRTNSTVSTNQTVAPDGTVTADRLIESTATGSHDIRQNEGGLSSGTQYTYSVFVKEYEEGSYRNVNFYVGGINSTGTFSFSTGTFTAHSFDSAKAVNYGNGWYRLEITDTTVSTTFNTIILTQNGTTTNYTGDGSSGFYLWGSQFEQGSYATSYIPTEGSSVTRSKDDVDTNYGDINSLSGEVSVYFNLLPQVSAASNTNKCLMFGFNSSSDTQSYANLRFSTTNWASRIQGTTGNNFNDLGINKTTEIKAVMVLTQSGYSLYANGSTAVASGSYGGTAPTINSVAYVQILNDSDDRGIYRIKELKVYNTALTATEAINLTS